MTILAAYNSHNTSASTPTRIDMLLSLYEAALRQIQLALDELETESGGQAIIHRSRAAALVTALRLGIDPSYGEVPVRVDQLCEFVQHCLVDGDAQRMEAGRRVLQELHEAFQGISDEARRLEANGAIPPLPKESTLDARF